VLARPGLPHSSSFASHSPWWPDCVQPQSMQWGAALLHVAAKAVEVVGGDNPSNAGSTPKGDNVEEEPQHGFQEVHRDDPVWNEVATLMRVRSRKYHGKYKYQEMVIRRLWRVPEEDGRNEAEEELEDQYGSPMQMFHGTDASSAESIATTGFRLPARPGMFGRGVYFARCPLKSIQYSKEPGKWFKFKKTAQDMVTGVGGATGNHRVMLVCDVYLGRQRTERNGRNLRTYLDVESAEDLKPTCFDLFCCPQMCCDYCRKGGWDSVYAPGGNRCTNLVRVSEFVVYDPRQAIPLFMVEFDMQNVRNGRRTDVVGEPVVVKEQEMEQRRTSRGRRKSRGRGRKSYAGS